MKQVVFVYKFLPQYRVDFFNKLKTSLLDADIDLKLIYGKSKNIDALKGDEVDIEWGTFVPNRSYKLGSKELIWQPCIKLLKKADLVIVQPENKLLLNFYLMVARRSSKYQMAYWGHGRNMQAPAGSFWNRLKSLYLAKCDWWFAYTRGVKEIIASKHFPKSKITVVQNAIDTMQLKNYYKEITPAEITTLKESLGIAGENIGIYCGSMYPEKRIDFILDVCLAVKESVPDFHMIFVGAGVDAVKIKKLAETNSWIHYVGPKFGKERVAYFKVASIQLMPGLVGLGIVDSFALESPIVTTKYPFHSPEIDYLENGYNGIITDDNFKSYAETVIDVLKNKKFLDLIAGCRVSSEKYTMEAMVDNFKQGIVECLAND